MYPPTRLWPVLSAGVAGALILGAAVSLAGCDTDPPPASDVASGEPASNPPSSAGRARALLAARAAAAKDLRYAALYTLGTEGRPDRTVVVTRATDGSWRVDIPGGALGGTADVSVARTRDGLFQCALPSVQRPVAPSCVRVADPDGELGARVDPKVQHVFVDWLEVLTDRDAAIAVSTASAGATPAGAGGTCFSVESNSASLTAPLDVGIYCYGTNGMLTGARLSFGTVVLASAPTPAPRTISLAGPVVSGEPLSMASPPAPTTEPPTPTTGAG